MTQVPQSAPAASRLGHWWRSWFGNRAGQAEFGHLDAQQISGIASDVGVSRAELFALAGKWPDSADLLSRRLAALNLDPAEIARTEPAVSRDMTKLCSLCDEKKRCEHDLKDSAVHPGWQKNCPNSQTLTALTSDRRKSERKTGRP